MMIFHFGKNLFLAGISQPYHFSLIESISSIVGSLHHLQFELKLLTERLTLGKSDKTCKSTIEKNWFKNWQ